MDNLTKYHSPVLRKKHFDVSETALLQTEENVNDPFWNLETSRGIRATSVPVNYVPESHGDVTRPLPYLKQLKEDADHPGFPRSAKLRADVGCGRKAASLRCSIPRSPPHLDWRPAVFWSQLPASNWSGEEEEHAARRNVLTGFIITSRSFLGEATFGRFHGKWQVVHLTKGDEVCLSSLYGQESDLSMYHVQRKLFSSSNYAEMDHTSYLTSGEAEKLCSIIQSCDSSFVKDHLGTESSSQLGKHLLNEAIDRSDKHPPESKEVESLKENWISYNRLMNKHRTRMKELLPSLKVKPQDSSLEESFSTSETKWLCEDAMKDKVAFQEMLHEAELAVGLAEMFLPPFKESLIRITEACYISASDEIISMQEDLLLKELEAILKMKVLLRWLLRSSKENEIISKQTEGLDQTLSESEMDVESLRNEVIQKEKHILELSTQLQQEKANLQKASRHSEAIQAVQTHLQCQIERKEAENNQLRAKFQTIEKNIAQWKIQVGEYKQQILAEKERKVERRNALKRAAVVQKQRAERMKVAVENLISKIKEKEIQLSEAFSASNIWKSHHEIVIEEKIRFEVQVESLKKQTMDLVMDLNRIQEDGRKSSNKIIQKLNFIASENKKISIENSKLKASLAVLEVNFISAEAELVNLHERVHQQEALVEQYKTEVTKLEMEAEELRTRYEKVMHDSRTITGGRDLETDVMRSQMEAHQKEVEHAHDLQKAAEEKLQNDQERLLSCQKSCVEKSKAIRELQAQIGDSNGFLKQLSLEEENYNIQLKYEEIKRKLEEMELQNKELENQLVNQEDSLQKTELQFKQKLAEYDALTRQLEAALENGRKQLAEELEKITSKEQSFQLKILDVENELREKKKEKKELSKRLDCREKHHEVSLKELEHTLQRSENQNQSIQNYVKFLKASYVTMFG
ncbi:protein BCAP [Candoia aspera]|uniref:protein BCAP n=1 Tax=Candoia aspera TaxID=51853 RepID=UPI002FD87605